MRDNLPALTFYGQYMQRPFVGDGAILKTSWLMQRDRPKESEILTRVAVLDTAQTKTKSADYSVIMIACILKEGGAFIEDICRERLEAPDLTEKVLEMYRMYRPTKIYIEYKSSGISLVQYLKKEKVPLPVVAIPRNAASGDGDSVCRANGIAPFVKAGYISVRKGAEWLSNFLHEVMVFPNGTHDDQVDALTDLVAREIVPSFGTLPVMDLGCLPIKGHSYSEELQEDNKNETPEICLEDILGKFNYRNKKREEVDCDDWSSGLF
jgi:predicted phage terminase large subunit-like protein